MTMMFTSNKNVNATIFLNLPSTHPYVIAFAKTIFTWFSKDPMYLNGSTDAYTSIERKQNADKYKKN